MKKLLKKIRSRYFLELYSFLYNEDIRKSCKVNGICKFNGKEIFGKNVNFNGCNIYGIGIVNFGDNFHSAEGLRIMTSYHNYKGGKIPYDETVITKNITIEDNVWVGLDVIILGGVTIGEGAIIQAGSVVVRDIPKYAICGGNPATVFAQRDIEHYKRLKSNQMFL